MSTRRAEGPPKPWWLWLALLAAVAVGLAAILIGGWVNGWSDELWLEIAKGGVQLLGVGVLGGALTLIWRDVSMRREQKSERNLKILTETASIIALYNQVKAVRRVLRSLGLDLNPHKDKQDRPERSESLTAKQARGFHKQMLVLNGLQLEFESKLKQFGQTNIFGKDNPQIVTLLRQIEHHLNGVLSLWEDRGWTIDEGTPLREVSDGLKRLFLVTGKDDFGPNVSDPIKVVVRLTGKPVFGEASTETQKAFTKAESGNS